MSRSSHRQGLHHPRHRRSRRSKMRKTCLNSKSSLTSTLPTWARSCKTNLRHPRVPAEISSLSTRLTGATTQLTARGMNRPWPKREILEVHWTELFHTSPPKTMCSKQCCSTTSAAFSPPGPATPLLRQFLQHGPARAFGYSTFP